MLEPDPAEPLGQREQEVVVIERARTEQRQRFVDQFLVRSDVLGLGVEQARLVSDDVELHRVPEVPHPRMRAGEHGGVDQRLVIDRRPGHAVPRPALPVERGEDLPSLGERHGRRDLDLPHVMPGRIEAYRLPLQIEHFGRHRDAPLAGLQRAGMDEACGHFACAGGDGHPEGIDFDRIARPFGGPPVDFEAQVGEQVELPAWRVLARQPLGQQQHQLVRARRHRDGLLHAIDAADEIGRIDVQRHRAGERYVPGRRYSRRKRRGDGRGTLRHLRGRRSGQQEHEGEGSGEAGYRHAQTLAATGSIRNHIRRRHLGERRHWS